MTKGLYLKLFSCIALNGYATFNNRGRGVV